MTKTRCWILILFSVVLCQCRADLPEDDTRLSSMSGAWYNSYGEVGECEPQTCGCSVKCSGEVGYKKDRPRMQTVKSNEDPDECGRNDVSYLRTIKSALVKTRELADCINGHVCQGHTVYCTQSDAEVSRNIRGLAKSKCETEVSELFCSEGRVNSWECPDAIVGTLSREWTAAFQSDDAQLRLCFQSLVCNNTEDRCAPNLLDRARSIKTALESFECKYWFESFCRLGSDGSL